VKQYWPEVDPIEVLDLLDQYGDEGHEKGRDRVQLAILKLCAGDLERLPGLIKMAKTDFQDVLAYAEYPEEMKTGFVKMSQLPEEEVEALRRRDRDQYIRWLEGE
jgi:hypothetical protein